jgi:hypothetical protein
VRFLLNFDVTNIERREFPQIKMRDDVSIVALEDVVSENALLAAAFGFRSLRLFHTGF